MGQQIGMQLGSLPIQIIYDSSGAVGFVRMANFPTVVENLEDGLQVIYSNEDIVVGTTELAYNTLYAYKSLPEVLYWLKSQQLEMPQL